MLWKWIGEETVLCVEDLGTWPVIAEIGEEEWWRIGEWNRERGELRRLQTFQII